MVLLAYGAGAARGQVVITEIMFNPAGDESVWGYWLASVWD